MTETVSAIALMNIAGMDDDTLVILRHFFITEPSPEGTSPAYVEAIDAELAARKDREP